MTGCDCGGNAHDAVVQAECAALNTQLDDGEAEVERLREALRDVLDNDCYHPENLPEGDERCRRARAALAGKDTE